MDEPIKIQSLEDFLAESKPIITPPFRSQFGATWLHETGRTRPKRDWLVKGLILARTFGVIFGAPGSGKSFLTTGLALAGAALGQDGQPQSWFGHRMTRFGVVYVVAEGRDDFEIRLHAWRVENKIPAETIIPFVFLPTSIDMRSNDADTIKLAAEINALSDQMEERCGVRVGLVVIDTVARALAGGNENASEVMGAFVINCGKLLTETNATVIGVHHGGKEAGRGPRGHEGLHGAADFEIEVAGQTEGAPNAWTVRKLKAGPGGATHRFRLKPISVGLDDDGDPVTSCVVREPEAGDGAQAQKKKGFRVNDTERQFLEALGVTIEQFGLMPPPGLQTPVNVQLVARRDDLRKVFFEKFKITEDGDEAQIEARLRQRWARATKGLLRFRVIAASDPYIWMTGKRVDGFRIRGAVELEDKPPRQDPPPHDTVPPSHDGPEVELGADDYHVENEGAES